MSASTATVMPANHLSGDGDAGSPASAVTSLPLTTNMTASSLTSGGNSCLDEQIERLKRCEYLREGEVKALCLRAREILVDESNVQRVDAPVTVRYLMVSASFSLQCEQCYGKVLAFFTIHKTHLFHFPLVTASIYYWMKHHRYAGIFTANSTI
jgi:hypothetical protein